MRRMAATIGFWWSSSQWPLPVTEKFKLPSGMENSALPVPQIFGAFWGPTGVIHSDRENVRLGRDWNLESSVSAGLWVSISPNWMPHSFIKMYATVEKCQVDLPGNSLLSLAESRSSDGRWPLSDRLARGNRLGVFEVDENGKEDKKNEHVWRVIAPSQVI